MTDYQEVKPLYYNTAKLLRNPDVIFRTNIGGNRYYYKFDNGAMVKAPSVTSVLDSEMQISEWLIRWIAEWGFRRAMEKRDESAFYGTFFSILAADFVKHGVFDTASVRPRLKMFVVNNNINFPTEFWEYKVKEDLYALRQFLFDYNVKPLAVELMLFSKHGFAGAIDAVVEMTIGTGVNGRILKTDRKYDKKTGEILEDKTRRVIAIIDWKTGRHGFYPINEAQLHMYKMMWEENFPHLPVDYLYNWSPKEWRATYGSFYHLKEQSDSKESKKIMNYLVNFQIEHTDKQDRIFKSIDGILELSGENGNLKFESFEERARKIHGISQRDEFLESIDESDTSPKVPEFTLSDGKTYNINSDLVKQEPEPAADIDAKRKELLEKALKNHTIEGAIINQLENILGS